VTHADTIHILLVVLTQRLNIVEETSRVGLVHFPFCMSFKAGFRLTQHQPTISSILRIRPNAGEAFALPGTQAVSIAPPHQ
jgi:hypothetical protein